MGTIDLDLNIKNFEKLKSEAKERGNKMYSEEEPNTFYNFEDCVLEFCEERVDGNTLIVSGSIMTPSGEDLGLVHLNVDLDFEKLIEIFQSYIKKLQKVKNVMESVKDE